MSEYEARDVLPSQAGAHEPPIEMINWQLAASLARRVTPSGPHVEPDEARAVVAALRAASRRAHQPVADTARLHAPGGPATARVVDRPTWSAVNIESFSALLDPVVRSLVVRPGKPVPGQLAQRIGGLATGAEVAAVLSFLSTKVLGQYDLAYAPGGRPELLLVAPNVVHVERELSLQPDDFRLWVCLHEETHRVQFTAVPWLREHMQASTREVAAQLVPDSQELFDRFKHAAANLTDVLRPGGTGLPELFLDEAQRHAIARIGAVMALLEGHADVVMDDVGPRVVPTVATIRARFDKRRAGISGLDLLIRRMLGLEAKMAQYRDGAAFVRAVTAHVGVDGFNAVWTSPETLPTPEEIRHPDRWVRRVHS